MPRKSFRTGLQRTMLVRASVIALLVGPSPVRAATVAELIAAVRAAQGRPDAEIAAMVRQTSLTERLDDLAIEALESEGAGSRTVEELEWLREDSIGLSAPSQPFFFRSEPPPSVDEQARLIERARLLAFRYTANLPNFVCTETVRRHLRPKDAPWHPTDTFTVSVSYSAKDGETYKLLTIGGKPTKKSLKDVGGFHSEGEFGSQLRHVFSPTAAAQFRFERWGSIRGRRVAVFSYHVDRAKSQYTVSANGGLFRKYRLITGVAGFVYVDPETGATLRLSGGDDGLPSNWPIRSTWSTVDYDMAPVAGQEFLLPKRVDVRVVLRESKVRNLMEFTEYRKFSADVSVTYNQQ